LTRRCSYRQYAEKASTNLLEFEEPWSAQATHWCPCPGLAPEIEARTAVCQSAAGRVRLLASPLQHHPSQQPASSLLGYITDTRWRGGPVCWVRVLPGPFKALQQVCLHFQLTAHLARASMQAHSKPGKRNARTSVRTVGARISLREASYKVQNTV
jgi:hypothetical protein